MYNIFPYTYYISLPATVKVATTSPSYGFVAFVAEIAGWYNLFLGGSILAFWETVWAYVTWWLAKINSKFSKLFTVMKVLFLLLSVGILIYTLVLCISTLLENPIGTNTLLSTTINGFSLSVCLAQFTEAKIDKYDTRIDIANLTEFWSRGNNLSSKIAELSVRKQDNEIITLWNRSMEWQQLDLFKITNTIRSPATVDFCHTIDLSLLPYQIKQILIHSVNDTTLVFHLAGQLLSSQSFYQVANMNTVKVYLGKIFLYESELGLHPEETTFYNISNTECISYNSTWTYDSCILDCALERMGKHQTVLKKLLRPDGSKIDRGVDKRILEELYSALLSQDLKCCKLDCRTLKVTLKEEASTSVASLISPSKTKMSDPLPPIRVKVNVTIPELSKINEVNISCTVDPNIVQANTGKETKKTKNYEKN
jgi:hypothetical protein